MANDRNFKVKNGIETENTDLVIGGSTVTASITELNKMNGVTSTTEEINYLSGVTSDIQTQLDGITVTLGQLTNSFIENESSTITLSGNTVAPIVSATKEVSQDGVSSKGDWDISTDGSNYTTYNSASNTSITVSSTGYNLDFLRLDALLDLNSALSYISPDGVHFKSDGLVMYTLDRNIGIHAWNLTTPYDISTASYSGDSILAASLLDSAFSDIFFKPDGTKMYVSTQGSADGLFEYDLSTPWDITSFSYNSVFIDLTGLDATTEGIYFKPDGTEIFITGRTDDNIESIDLSTPWDLSTDSTGQSPVSTGVADPTGLAFNDDGTEVYFVNTTGLHRNTLSVAWDLTSLGTREQITGVSAISSYIGLHIDNSGKSLYICENGIDSLQQFDIESYTVTLGAGSFSNSDIGKTVTIGNNVGVIANTSGHFYPISGFSSNTTATANNWTLSGIKFTADGAQLSNYNSGYERFVTRAVSQVGETSSFTTLATLVGGGPGGENHARMSNDGRTMIINETLNDVIKELSLSRPWDLSTLSDSGNSFSPVSQQYGLDLNDDGTILFNNVSTTSIGAYSLASPFSLSTTPTIIYSVSFIGDLTGASITGFGFGNSGLKLYLTETGGYISEYTLSTAYDLRTATYVATKDISGTVTSPVQISVSPDGKTFLLGNNGNGSFFIGFAITPYDISTLEILTGDIPQSFSSCPIISFEDGGSRLLAAGETVSQSVTRMYQLGKKATVTNSFETIVTNGGQIDTTYWTDINSMTADETLNNGNVYYAVSNNDHTTWNVIDNTDGIRPIVRNNGGTWEYNSNTTYTSTTWVAGSTNSELATLSEALEDGVAEEVIGFNDANTWSYDSVSFSVGSQGAGPSAIEFNNDGTKMYVLNYNDDEVNQYTLSTAFDLSTASFDSVTFSVASQESVPTGLTFNNDGTKMYITGTTGDDVNEYALSAAFDISTASYTTVFSVGGLETSPQDITFNNDGTKMYVMGNTGDDINEFSLSTAFDISTASYTTVFSVAGQDTSPTGMAFNNDGTKMYIVGITGDDVNQYTLSTAFDISTASFDSVVFSVASEDTIPQGIVFNNDGTKMYIIGDANDTVYQYSSGTVTNQNRMNSTQLNAVTDPNHYTLGDTLDLAIIFNSQNENYIPISDGVSINYQSAALNQSAVPGTDYVWEAPAQNQVKITSLASQNLKIRVV